MNAIILSDPRTPWIIGIMICLVVVAVLLALEVFERRKPKAAKCQSTCAYCASEYTQNVDEDRSAAKVATFYLELAVAKGQSEEIARCLGVIDASAMRLANAADCAKGKKAFEDFVQASHSFAYDNGPRPRFPSRPVAQ